MIKKVIRPFWSFDVQKTEKWLSQMAENGFLLEKINRIARCFYFRKGEPKTLTYRIGFDKMQGESLASVLMNEGWAKVLRAGSWFVTSNERPMGQIKTSTVRDGIIKHNRIISNIFGIILFWFSMMLIFFLSSFGLSLLSPDSQVEVVESPYWIFTYLYFAVLVMAFVLSVYTVIKIHQTNKNLLNEKATTQNTLGKTYLSKSEEKEYKQSGRLIRKRKLGWMYAPDKLEQWLEKMEDEGYHLYRVSKTGTLFYFLKGHSRKISYCADYQNISDESYFDIHQDAGWKKMFVSFGSLQKWTIWSREYPKGEVKPVIYSDKTNQLKQARKVAIVYTCLFLPLILIYMVNLGLGIELMDDYKLDSQHIFTIIVMVLAILTFGSFSVRTWMYYNRLKKRIG
ncbi:DUF2812 domain-containing protein [Neobacillus sp. 19]|uniref:DUF2812 domain-containing protein n=1 Tax=Neobacillus sp. 19 TaxID=3394458 RepID=UPI003BF650A2